VYLNGSRKKLKQELGACFFWKNVNIIPSSTGQIMPCKKLTRNWDEQYVWVHAETENTYPFST
jgi:hypothetical protein